MNSAQIILLAVAVLLTTTGCQTHTITTYYPPTEHSSIQYGTATYTDLFTRKNESAVPMSFQITKHSMYRHSTDENIRSSKSQWDIS